MNHFGISAANTDGSYNFAGDLYIQRAMAAVLTATLSAVFFLTAQLLLPTGWSVLVALGGAFGTQVWSTASRGLWSDTWGMLLLGLVLFHLLARTLKQQTPAPELVATLLAWSYFCRPTYSVAVIVIAIYILSTASTVFRRFALAGMVWLLLFVAYSWLNFHKLVPSYFARRYVAKAFLESVGGNLFSPNRGLIIYIPVTLFVGYLLVRYWRWIRLRALTFLALVGIAGYMIVLGGFDHWWGGDCYGPRLTAGIVPFVVLLAIFSIDAMRRGNLEGHRLSKAGSFATAAVGLVLLSFSVFANARGALDRETWAWNMRIKEKSPGVQDRLWNWRYPQMLAGLIRTPIPDDCPMVWPHGILDLSQPGADSFLWYGWSGPEPGYRWNQESEAAIAFAAKPGQSIDMSMDLTPLILASVHPTQRVTLKLNDCNVGQYTLDAKTSYPIKLQLPGSCVRERNALVFVLPDAASPKELGIGEDLRRLAVAIKRIEFNAPAQ
jgi:hypothetical protein